MPSSGFLKARVNVEVVLFTLVESNIVASNSFAFLLSLAMIKPFTMILAMLEWVCGARPLDGSREYPP